MRFIFFLSLILLSSCALFKHKNAKCDVSGKIEIHRPYCGGAKPTPEMQKGTTEPYANAVFYVKTQMNNDKKEATVLKFTTDAEGKFEFKIKKGNYIVISEDKTLTFEEYVKKLGTSNDKFLEYIGDEEAKKVYEKLDFALDVQVRTAIDYKYKTRCFSGRNILLKYVGPLPQ